MSSIPDAEKKSVAFHLRLNPAQAEKFREIGGVFFLRNVLDEKIILDRLKKKKSTR